MTSLNNGGIRPNFGLMSNMKNQQQASVKFAGKSDDVADQADLSTGTEKPEAPSALNRAMSSVRRQALGVRIAIQMYFENLLNPVTEDPWVEKAPITQEWRDPDERPETTGLDEIEYLPEEDAD